jgi:mannose-6-phosphate isomerase-like protein (cupin superfamily)
MTAFVPLPIANGTLLELDGIKVIGWAGEPAAHSGGTIFGMITSTSQVTIGPDTFTLRTGAYFVASEPVQITSGSGLGIVLANYRGLRQLGGPIEPTGRLRYIDGCSDTLLVCPPRLGEPCLNHLHLPARTDQSEHTHPTARIGVIAKGTGRCRTASGPIDLKEGLGWYIPPGLKHSFVTGEQSLDVLAWHPDSDFGPTDEDHPMVNRTFVSSKPG